MNFLHYLFNASHEDCIWLLDYLKRQKELCEKGINEGNWEGYAENLKIRKDNLRNINANIEIIELKLKEYERSN